MQIDKADAAVIGVVEDIIDVEIAMDVYRERCHQCAFAIGCCADQRFEVADTSSTDGLSAMAELRVDTVDLVEPLPELGHVAGLSSGIGTGFLPDRA